MKKEKLSPEKRLEKNLIFRKKCFTVSTVVFFVVMLACMVFCFLLPFRPTFSKSEKRDLAKLPKPSVQTLLNGDFFDSVNLWFADTMPLRDELIKSSNVIKKCIGVGDSIHNFTETERETIPNVTMKKQEKVVVSVKKPDKKEEKSEVPTLPALQVPSHKTAENSNDENALEQSLGAVFIKGNTAYEYYNFVSETADEYANTINKAADKLTQSGISVYNMIVPTSIDITLNDTTRKKLSSDDQNNAINYMTSKLDDNVKPVMVYDLLKEHRDEYIYFRTDHHWTALGAYYAYAQLMNVMGNEFEPLTSFTEYTFDGFLGSFYSDTNKSVSLSKTPDTVYAYKPKADISFKAKFDGDTDYTSWPLICDATDYDESYKYLCFIGGDNSISVITNNSIKENKKCMLVKESFGNAFAPYLACNYSEVYIVDYRHFDGNIVQTAIDLSVDDVIFQNNISMTRNAGLVKALDEKT